jgi:hypothetical protein
MFDANIIRLLPNVPLVEKVPAMVKPELISKVVAPVTFSGVIVKFAQVALIDTVTVKCAVPEFMSKITLSTDVGTEAPDAPPEVADHFVVLFQDPEPPTQ